MKRSKILLFLTGILLVLTVFFVAVACDSSDGDLPSGELPSGIASCEETPSGEPTDVGSGNVSGDVSPSQTYAVSLHIGETVEDCTAPQGTSIAQLLSDSTAYAQASESKWLRLIVDREGNEYTQDDLITGDTSLTLTMESPFGYHIYLSEATGVDVQGMSNSTYSYNPFFRIMGNTIDIIERDVVNDCLVATVNGEQVTLGRVRGYYYDADYTQAIERGEELSTAANDWKSIYVRITWSISPSTLGADINLRLFDGEAMSIAAKTNSLMTVSGLLSPSATSKLAATGNYAKVEYGSNNQVAKVSISRNGNITQYEASESDSYYVSYKGSILTGLSGTLTGEVTFSRTGQRVATSYRGPSIEVKHINRHEFCQSLEGGLKIYLNSDAFAKLLSSQSNASRMTFSYLKYVDYNFYDEVLVETAFKELVLDRIKTIIKDGEIDDTLWYTSTVKTQGWYGYFDFFNTWAYTYQQYSDYLYKSGKSLADNEYAQYLPAIQRYYEKWIPLILTDSLYQNAVDVYNTLNNWSKIGQDGYPQTVDEAISDIQSKLDSITGKYDDEVFAESLQWLQDNLYRLRFTGASESISMFKSQAQSLYGSIRLGASFGFSYMQCWLLVYENLGFDVNSSTAMESVIAKLEDMYYTLNDDGTYKESTGCNWVGWSGAPIVRSVLAKYSDKYFVEYDKSQQAYFPFQDKGMTQQGLEAMVNLDRLYDYYNHTLTSGSNVSPGYALLTMYMHGIDPEHYTKAVETSSVDNEYNVIERWTDNLGYDQEGNVVIDNTLDMAIAICYIVKSKGVDAPAPWGIVNPSEALITL